MRSTPLLSADSADLAGRRRVARRRLPGGRDDRCACRGWCRAAGRDRVVLVAVAPAPRRAGRGRASPRSTSLPSPCRTSSPARSARSRRFFWSRRLSHSPRTPSPTAFPGQASVSGPRNADAARSPAPRASRSRSRSDSPVSGHCSSRCRASSSRLVNSRVMSASTTLTTGCPTRLRQCAGHQVAIGAWVVPCAENARSEPGHPRDRDPVDLEIVDQLASELVDVLLLSHHDPRSTLCSKVTCASFTSWSSMA